MRGDEGWGLVPKYKRKHQFVEGELRIRAKKNRNTGNVLLSLKYRELFVIFSSYNFARV